MTVMTQAFSAEPMQKIHNILSSYKTPGDIYELPALSFKVA